MDRKDTRLTRRQFLRLAAVGVGGAVLSSCAPKPTATPVPAKPTEVPPTKAPEPTAVIQPTAAPAEKIVLSFMRPGLGEDALQEVAAQMTPYYEKYPNIELETLVLAPPEVGPKLLSAVAGGEPPDLAMVFPGAFLQFAIDGHLLDMTPLAEEENWDWKNYFIPEFSDVYAVGGKFLGMNESVASEALAYNKKMFDEAGIDYPDDTWTWDDCVAIGKELTVDKDGDGKTDIYGFTNIPWDYQPWIWSAGKAFFNEDYTRVQTDDPDVVATFQWLADLRYKHGICPTPEVSSAYGADAGGLSQMFIQGLSAMKIVRWIPTVAFFFGRIPEAELPYDVAPFPKHPQTGLRGSGSGGGLTTVFAATKYPREAYAVCKYMLTDEGIYHRSAGLTGVPMVPNCQNAERDCPMLTKAFQELTRPAHAQVFLDALAYTRLSELPVPNSAEFYDEVDVYLEQLWLGTMDAAEACSKVKEVGDPILQKNV